MNTDDITLMETYDTDEYTIYGLWDVDGQEIAAVVGVPEYQRGTADAAGNWGGLVSAFWGSPDGADQGALDDWTAEELLAELSDHASALMERELGAEMAE